MNSKIIECLIYNNIFIMQFFFSSEIGQDNLMNVLEDCIILYLGSLGFVPLFSIFCLEFYWKFIIITVVILKCRNKMKPKKETSKKSCQLKVPKHISSKNHVQTCWNKNHPYKFQITLICSSLGITSNKAANIQILIVSFFSITSN